MNTFVRLKSREQCVKYYHSNQQYKTREFVDNYTVNSAIIRIGDMIEANNTPRSVSKNSLGRLIKLSTDKIPDVTDVVTYVPSCEEDSSLQVSKDTSSSCSRGKNCEICFILWNFNITATKLIGFSECVLCLRKKYTVQRFFGCEDKLPYRCERAAYRDDVLCGQDIDFVRYCRRDYDVVNGAVVQNNLKVKGPV